MNRTSYLARLVTFAPLVLAAALLGPAPGRAQYLFLDTDGDGVHTAADVVNPGTTHVDVWLDTQHDRGGAFQSCNAHSGASQGGVSEGPDMFSYDIFLLAEHGTVSWGAYQDCVGFHPPPNEELNTHTETAIHITRYADLGEEKPAGRYRLGALTVTATSGTPLVRFGLMQDGDYCAFGTDCPASEFPNTYCYGIDFYDADGLRYGGPSNHAPVFDSVPPLTVIQNHPADVTLHASDEDLDPLTFTLVSGPSFATVSDLPIAGQARLHLAPGPGDVGTFMIQVRVSDGANPVDRYITGTVKRELALYPIPDFTLQGGASQERYLYTDNPLGHALTYSVASGPPFVTLGSAEPASAWMTIHPAVTDVGDYTVTIAVTDGMDLQDQTTFHVTVTSGTVAPPDGTNRPPVAAIFGPADGIAGRAVRFDGSGSSDPDGDLLGYAWSFGDGSALVSDLHPQHVYAAEGTYQVDLTVHDKEFYRTTTSTVRVAATAGARAFVPGGSGGPARDLEIRVQPLTDAFDAAELGRSPVSSFSLTNAAGDRILARGLAGDAGQDVDHDGTAEDGVVFTASDVARLTSRGVDRGIATVTLRGALANGGQFVATLGLAAFHGRGPLHVDLSPNPLNPVGRLTFLTSRPGVVDVRVYDIAGRLAHHPIDRALLPAGSHQVLVGRGRGGEDLPSGIYFFQLLSPEGVARGRFAIVR
jgi:hypothetical protein